MIDVHGASDEFERLWADLKPAERRRIEDDWPDLKGVAERCIQITPERDSRLRVVRLQQLSWFLREGCWRLSDTGAKMLLRTAYADSRCEYARFYLLDTLKRCWARYRPEAGPLEPYLRKFYILHLRQQLVSDAPGPDDDARRPETPVDIENEPDPRPGFVERLLERLDTTPLYNVLTIAVAEYLLGGHDPAKAATEGEPTWVEPPHRGIPWWAIRLVEGNFSHEEGRPVRDFTEAHGTEMLQWVGDQYKTRHRLRWHDEYRRDLPEAALRAFERLDGRLEQPVADFVPEGPGRKNLAMGLLEQPAGETVLESYTTPGNLTKAVHYWLDQTWRKLRPVLTDVGGPYYDSTD